MRSGIWARRSGVLALALLALPVRLWATTANDLCAPAANPCVVNAPVTVTDGSLIDVGTRELRIANGGALDVGSGDMMLRAGTLTINSGGFVRGLGSSTTAGGTVDIQAGTMTVGGTIDISGSPGGTLTIAVTGALSVTGPITARSLAREQLGGNVDISAGTTTFAATVSLLGGFDAIGGDLTIDTTGDLTITGTLLTDGGDGGGIDIRVGRPESGANFTLGDSGVITANATTGGGFAGAIDIVIDGNGTSTGLATVRGQMTAIGEDGSLDLGGGSGGCIEIQSKGDLRIDRSGATLNVDGGAPDGDGGEVDLTSDTGAIVMQGSATASVGGEESNGGAVSMDAFKDATVSGSITITAGDGGGGEATISSTSGAVTIARTAAIDVSSVLFGAGQGGGICLESGTGTGSRTITVEGRLSSDGGPGGGAGGGIDLSGGDSVRIASTGLVRAAGGTGGGRGGTVTVTADPGIALVEGPVTATGGGPNGQGGIIAVEAVGRVNITAALDARGLGTGGQVGIASDIGPIDVMGNVTASSSGAAGGSIEVTAQGDIRLASNMIADGNVAPGGRIEVVGCDVTVCGLDSPACPAGGTGVLSSLGPSGLNRVTGRDTTGIFGTMRSNQASGRNELVYNGAESSEPIVLGTITPAATVLVDGSVLPCPRCGNRNIEPPETCDDGNTEDGDGCSATCQTEAGIPGDANGDQVVSAADLGFAIAEIFDGDGDSVTTVSGGAFPGSPGADANGDDHVTVADLTATIEILAQ